MRILSKTHIDILVFYDKIISMLTLEEFHKLRRDEMQFGTLRSPKVVSYNSENFEKLGSLIGNIFYYTTTKEKMASIRKTILRNPLVDKNSLAKLKSFKCFDLYNLNVPSIGKGYFCKANDFFQSQETPSFITPGHCFCNSIILSAVLNQNNFENTLLSGISCFPQILDENGNEVKKAKPFLHSVVCLEPTEVFEDGCVLDFNYNLGMSKDLYTKLFNFEILNQIPSSKVQKDFDKIGENTQKDKNYYSNNDDIDTWDMNYVFAEVIDRIK